MEEKRIYYVGIDHGNHLMKTSNHVFENGVERQAVKPTFQANTLVYDGAFYKIGEKRKGNSREQFYNILQKNMQPVYDSARRQGYEVWNRGM